MTARKSFLYVLLAYGVCQLAILAGDITIFAIRYATGTFYNLAWPHPLTGRGFDLPAAVNQIVEITAGWFVLARVNFQGLVNRVIPDAYNVASMIVATAVLEEVQYRGPLWLLKKCPAYVWWPAALLVNTLFLLSHNTAPIFLAYIFVFAMMCAWLVRKTGKLWPSVVLHMIYNTYWMFGGITNMRG